MPRKQWTRACSAAGLASARDGGRHRKLLQHAHPIRLDYLGQWSVVPLYADQPANAQSHLGFFGTIRRHAEPVEAWPIALRAVARATATSDLTARDFLDSRHGHHFADDVADALCAGDPLKDAIDAAVTRWMA